MCKLCGFFDSVAHFDSVMKLRSKIRFLRTSVLQSKSFFFALIKTKKFMEIWNRYLFWTGRKKFRLKSKRRRETPFLSLADHLRWPLEGKIDKIPCFTDCSRSCQAQTIRGCMRATENEHNNAAFVVGCSHCKRRTWLKYIKVGQTEIPVSMQTQSNQLITSPSQHISQPLCYATRRMHLIGNEHGTPCNL